MNITYRWIFFYAPLYHARQDCYVFYIYDTNFGKATAHFLQSKKISKNILIHCFTTHNRTSTS